MPVLIFGGGPVARKDLRALTRVAGVHPGSAGRDVDDFTVLGTHGMGHEREVRERR